MNTKGLANTSIILIVIAIVVIILIILLGSNLTGNADQNNRVNQTNQSPQVKTYSVTIDNFAFSPSSLTINKGDVVVWTNNKTAPHTVTSGSGSELESAILRQGQKYSHVFNTTGTYAYYCAIHPNMKGTIIVQ